MRRTLRKKSLYVPNREYERNPEVSLYTVECTHEGPFSEIKTNDEIVILDFVSDRSSSMINSRTYNLYVYLCLCLIIFTCKLYVTPLHSCKFLEKENLLLGV